MRLFLGLWLFVAATMGLMAVIGLRVDKLRRSGRAPGAPDWFHPPNSLRIVGYVFSSRYRETGDELLARLVPIARVCYILIPVMAFVFLVIARAGA